MLAPIEKCPAAGRLPVVEYIPLALEQIVNPAVAALSLQDVCGGNRFITRAGAGSMRAAG